MKISRADRIGFDRKVTTDQDHSNAFDRDLDHADIIWPGSIQEDLLALQSPRLQSSLHSLKQLGITLGPTIAEKIRYLACICGTRDVYFLARSLLSPVYMYECGTCMMTSPSLRSKQLL